MRVIGLREFDGSRTRFWPLPVAACMRPQTVPIDSPSAIS